MADRAQASALFWQVWAAAAALATAISFGRLLLPRAPTLVAHERRAAAHARAEPTTVVELAAAPAPVDPLLARLASATTSSERCQLLGQLETSEDARITYAITSVLESSQLVSVRACATQALGLQSTPAARSWLVDLTDDPEPEVHSSALGTLAGSMDAADRAVVIEATHSENAEVRVSAVNALLQLGLPEGFAAFEALLPSIEDRNTLSTLIDSLRQSRDARALPALVTLIERADGDNHLEAIGALGDIDVPSSVAHLEALLDVGSDSEFRTASAALTKLAPTATSNKLRALLASGNEDRQSFALTALLSSDTPDQLQILSEQLRSSNPQNVRTVLMHLTMKPEPSLEAALTDLARNGAGELGNMADNALARISSPSARAAALELGKLPRKGRFKRMWADEEPTGTEDEIRMARIARLERGDDTSNGALYSLVTDTSEAAQAAALRYVGRPGNNAAELGALASSGPPSTLRQLVGQQARLDDPHRRALIQAVAQRGDPQFSGVLKDALRDSDQATHNSALRGLLEMGDESVLGDLDRLVRASDPADRSLAAELLGARGNAMSARALQELAGDPNPEVVASALHALQLQSPEQISELSQRAFRAASPEDRVTLLNSLSDLKPSMSRPLYDLALSSPDEATTLQAVQSLTNLAGPESAQRLLAVINDSNRSHDVRAEAASGLRQLGGPLARANRAVLDALSPVEALPEGDPCCGM